MKKVVLFYNPVAGGGTFKNRLDDIIAIMQSNGLQLIPWRIQSNQQLVEDMAHMDLSDCHTVIAAGGDGTVHGVVNAMLQCNVQVPMGIFPIGTANDTARNLHIPSNLEGYCHVITHGTPQNIDVGKVDEKYFINVASAGFMTEVAHQVSSKSKNILGKGAYYLKGVTKLPDMKPFLLKGSVDGNSFACKAFLFLLMNGKGAGSIEEIIPCATMDDGMLDLMVVKDGSPVQLLSTLGKSLVGNHMEDSLILHLRGKEFFLETEPAIETDLDGETGPAMPWQVQVLPGAIQIRVPSITGA